MSNKVFAFLVIVLLLGLFLIVRFGNTKSNVDTTFPHAEIGKTVKISDLIRVDGGTLVDNFQLPGEGMAAIFILKPSCFHCEPNLFMWKKIKRTFKDQLKAFGIILSEPSDAVGFSRSKNLNFPLYTVFDKKKFKVDFKVKYDLSQTILLKESKISYSKSGHLRADDFFEIKKLLQRGD